ncbi:glycerol-3-phosphate dehydrogenase [Platysternon megacephalum]|uniref:Glycerol-3-phosphate dehydrogenase n=1 Tax=Platysternon megacephalum TaxID=55544 RepID=A0A4D9DDV5_9SAUR|nr:glycerol-3-phosphate dehydrogenase [Platysternon megacephalum]
MAVGIALLLGLGSAAGAFLVSTDPSPVTALLGSDVLLTCSFPAAPRGGARDETLLVSWYFQERRVAEFDGIPISTRVGAILFSQQQGHAQASLLLPGLTLADQGPYRCSVRYAGQHGQGTVQVQVAVLPRVEVPSPVVWRDEDSALLCWLRGFYPQHIAVSWLRDGQELNASFVSAARQGHRDGTFSLVTVYRFTPTARDLGALFSCQARHPLLNQSRQADFRIAFRAGGLEMGLRVLLWMLRVSLLLAMAMGGWLCCDTSSRPRKMVEQMMEQATERIWDPLRQRFQQAREAISSWSR